MYQSPRMDLGQYQKPVQTRSSCPSCGAAITPEQDTQIREQDRRKNESIVEKLRVAGLSPEEQAQYHRDRGDISKGRYQPTLPEGQKPLPPDVLSERKQEGSGQWGDNPPPNSSLRYTAVMPPAGMRYVYNQQTGERRTVPISGRTLGPKVGPDKTYNPIFDRPIPTGDLFNRKQKEETGFYQGPSVAEQKRGTTWGSVPKPSQQSQPQYSTKPGPDGTTTYKGPEGQTYWGGMKPQPSWQKELFNRKQQESGQLGRY